MNRIEDIVYYDFQGWPEYKMNLRMEETDRRAAGRAGSSGGFAYEHGEAGGVY